MLAVDKSDVQVAAGRFEHSFSDVTAPDGKWQHSLVFLVGTLLLILQQQLELSG